MNEQIEPFSYESTSIRVRQIKSGPPLSWFTDSFRLVRAHWKTIVPAYLVVMVVSILMQLGIELLLASRASIGTILALMVVYFLSILLPSGMMAVFHGAAEGKPRIGDVFRGFKGRNILSMFLFCLSMLVIFSAFALAMLSLIKILGGGSMMSDMSSYGSSYGNPFSRMMAAIMGWPSLIVICFVLGLLVIMALVNYAIPQIIVSGEGPISALDNSLKVTFKNFFLLLVFSINGVALYGLVVFCSMFSAALTASFTLTVFLILVVVSAFGLILNGAYYLSFRHVLLSQPQAADAVHV